MINALWHLRLGHNGVCCLRSLTYYSVINALWHLRLGHGSRRNPFYMSIQ
ncbi:hypothetical protein H1P_2670007 [Hyella patelloides LEGE 07179]|uniref:Uncharacterized protein n=1 Tax=Hyella patelloides LEGE 07179 TaxID=945734 RepID=A0A563VSM7_9CYAN|nr:hypothetical protein H1P_2670007 [Hyella patelloides LEGE 07179]